MGKEKDQLESRLEKSKGRVRAEGTAYMAVSAFPEELYKQWKTDCEKNFGDCHWIKIWHDHVQSKQVQRLDRLENRLLEIEAKVLEFSQKPKEEEQSKGSAETFGGTIKPRGGD